MPLKFVWEEFLGLVEAGCPICSELFGYERGDEELKALFAEDCKMKRILKRREFPLDEPDRSEEGAVAFERRYQWRQLTASIRRAWYDRGVDMGIERMEEILRAWGSDAKRGIFISRFKVVNLGAVPRYAYLYRVYVVPAFVSPYIPGLVFQGVEKEAPEEEIERLVFTGRSSLKEKIVTEVRL